MTNKPDQADIGADKLDAIVAERDIYSLSRMIEQLCPSHRPPVCHWLSSDAGLSYCYDCAVKARAEEFGLGPPLMKRNKFWMASTDLEESFYEGIEGAYDITSDSPESCHTCGCTLSHILTDYGVSLEISHFLEHPVDKLDPETSYALDRMVLNISDWEGQDQQQLRDAVTILGQAVRAHLLKETNNDR